MAFELPAQSQQILFVKALQDAQVIVQHAATVHALSATVDIISTTVNVVHVLLALLARTRCEHAVPHLTLSAQPALPIAVPVAVMAVPLVLLVIILEMDNATRALIAPAQRM
jgi:lysylphosphatidylglycerol synthetase-like protein (DUF2156 family)